MRQSQVEKGMNIHIKSPAEQDKMRAAGALARKVLEYTAGYIKPGITTNELDKLADDFTTQQGAVSAPMNYRGFPKHICTSIDNVVCHGIPNDEALKEGQMINVDITVILDGFHGDCSETYFVGEVAPEKSRLAHVAKTAMWRGIQQVKPGATLGDVGYAIQKYVERNGYSVVRDFIGHGIGRNFHEDPPVHHVGKKGRGVKLKPGMTFTVEPMVNEGSYHVEVLDDEWTVITVDGGMSAQFEHTILVTENGVEVLTAPQEEAQA